MRVRQRVSSIAGSQSPGCSLGTCDPPDGASVDPGDPAHAHLSKLMKVAPVSHTYGHRYVKRREETLWASIEKMLF